MDIVEHQGQEGFWFGPQFIRLVRGFTTEAGTVEDIGFVATDLAKALEHYDATRLTRLLDPDQKGLHRVETPGGLQSLTVISESGFYDVVVRSDKPQGKQLRAVVTREILPQIRKTGGYSAQPAISPVSEITTVIGQLLPVLKREFPTVDANLLNNAVVEGAARQYPTHRALLEPVKLALAPTLEEPVVTVTELAEAYRQTPIGRQHSLRDLLEGSVITLKRKTDATMMNQLLIKAGLQTRVETGQERRYEPTAAGSDYAKTILTTAKDVNRTVPQVRWKRDSTVEFLVGWVEANHRAA
jgi:hypothetical protein